MILQFQTYFIIYIIHQYLWNAIKIWLNESLSPLHISFINSNAPSHMGDFRCFFSLYFPPPFIALYVHFTIKLNITQYLPFYKFCNFELNLSAFMVPWLRNSFGSGVLIAIDCTNLHFNSHISFLKFNSHIS